MPILPNPSDASHIVTHDNHVFRPGVLGIARERQENPLMDALQIWVIEQYYKSPEVG